MGEHSPLLGFALPPLGNFDLKVNQFKFFEIFNRVSTIPGLWTGLDCGLDSGLDRGLTALVQSRNPLSEAMRVRAFNRSLFSQISIIHMKRLMEVSWV